MSLIDCVDSLRHQVLRFLSNRPAIADRPASRHGGELDLQHRLHPNMYILIRIARLGNQIGKGHAEMSGLDSLSHLLIKRKVFLDSSWAADVCSMIKQHDGGFS